VAEFCDGTTPLGEGEGGGVPAFVPASTASLRCEGNVEKLLASFAHCQLACQTKPDPSDCLLYQCSEKYAPILSTYAHPAYRCPACLFPVVLDPPGSELNNTSSFLGCIDRQVYCQSASEAFLDR
jgi:hypothetical protein